MGFSSCSLGAPEYQAQLPWGMWDFLRPGDWTGVPCFARWILNHWTTREALLMVDFLKPCLQLIWGKNYLESLEWTLRNQIQSWFINRVDLKKCIMWELQVKLYLRQNVDQSGREYLKQLWETAPKRQGVKVTIYVILVKEKYMQSSPYFSRFLLVSWSLLLVMRNNLHQKRC